MRRYAKVALDLKTTEWTAVVPPIDCDFFWVRERAGTNVILESMENRAPADDGYDDELPAGALQFLPPPAGSVRFVAGETITWLRAKDVPCKGVVTFIL